MVTWNIENLHPNKDDLPLKIQFMFVEILKVTFLYNVPHLSRAGPSTFGALV